MVTVIAGEQDLSYVFNLGCIAGNYLVSIRRDVPGEVNAHTHAYTKGIALPCYMSLCGGAAVKMGVETVRPPRLSKGRATQTFLSRTPLHLAFVSAPKTH